MRTLALCSLLVAAALSRSSAGFLTHWTYADAPTTAGLYGPESWGTYYPSCGTRLSTERQSPINFATADIDAKPSLGALSFAYQSATQMVAVNLGATLQLSMNTTAEGYVADSSILRGGLGGDYYLEQVHFHWNNNALTGSEHAFAGHRTAAEMHLVHRSSAYSTLSEAVASGQSGAVTVVGVLFNLSPTGSTELNKIVAIASQVAEPSHDSTGVSVGSFDVQKLLPKRSQLEYFHYNGSLTTPGCDEVVRWYVIQTASTITTAQLAALRMLKQVASEESAEGTTLAEADIGTHNVRPLQPINGRRVWAYPEYLQKETLVLRMSSSSVASALLAFELLGTFAIVGLFAFILVMAVRRNK